MHNGKVSNKSWPSTLAAREKLITIGPDTLTDIELLTLFCAPALEESMCCSSRKELLAQFGSFDNLMIVDHQTMSATYDLGLKMSVAAGDWRNDAAYFRSHLMR